MRSWCSGLHRQAGRSPTLAGGGEREYLLASIGGTVAAPPLAVLQLNGLSASALFLRGTFDKLGVSPNFAHVGRYKSAVEGYTRTDMSAPAREALQGLVDDQYTLLTDSLGAALGILPDSVGRLLDGGPFDAAAALARGLVDTLLYRAELDSLATTGEDARRPTLTLTRYLERIDEPGAGRIALITAAGAIVEGRSRGGGPGPGGGARRRNDHQGAARGPRPVVDQGGRPARIDSPGGSAEASDDIWSEVKGARSASR